QLQRVQAGPLAQSDDLLRQGAAGPRSRAVLREPGDVRRARPRAQGVHPLHGVRGLLRGARPERADLSEDSMNVARLQLAPVGETMFPPRAPFFEGWPAEPPGSPGREAPPHAHAAEAAA